MRSWLSSPPLEVVADADERLRQPQVLLVPGRAVEIDDRHVVRRADGAAGELERLVRREVLEEAAALRAASSSVVDPGHLVVAHARGDEVAQVVGLEVEAVGEGEGVLVVARGDEGRRVEVAVLALHRGDQLRDLLDVRRQVGVGVGLEARDGRFQPLVEVAVHERAGRRGRRPRDRRRCGSW